MKKLILLAGVITSLAIVNVVFGQTTGVIAYETKVNMHRNIPAERADMKAMIPEFRTTKQQLFFNDNESLFKTVIEDEDEQPMSVGGGSGTFTVRMGSPNTELYLNQSANTITSKQELGGKNYLIIDSIKMAPWKFSDQVKTIAGYECRMAYYTRTDTIPMMVIGSASADAPKRQPQIRTQEITAWYTDKIRPFLGPERFNTLPGVVLAIDINNGERVIVARKVEIRELKKNELKAPSSGTKITQEEFNKLLQEQMKQMGGGRPMMIR